MTKHEVSLPARTGDLTRTNLIKKGRIMKTSKRRGLVIGFGFWMALACCVSLDAWAQDAGDIANDTCILELALPQNASVTVDGRDYGAKREFTFNGLRPGKKYHSTVQVDFPGSQKQRTVFIEGGRRLRMSLQPSDSSLPELVLQTGHSQGIDYVAFSNDGKRVLTAGDESRASLWDTENGRLLRVFDVPKDVRGVAFGPNDKRVMILTGIAEREFGGKWFEDAAIVFDATTGRQLWAIEKNVDEAVFLPKGNQVITRHSDEVTFWDAETGRRLRSFTLDDNYGSLTVTADGRLLAVQAPAEGERRDIHLYEVASGKRSRILSGHAGHIKRLSFSVDGSYMLSVDSDRAILWDAKTWRQIRTFDKKEHYFETGVLSPDGRSVLLVCGSKIRIWNRETKQEKSFDRSCKTVEFSPNSRSVLTSYYSHNIVLWDPDTGKELQAFGGRTDIVNSAAFNTGGTQLLTLTDDNLAAWQRATGQPGPNIRVRSGESIATARDSRYALVNGGILGAMLCNVDSGEVVQTFALLELSKELRWWTLSPTMDYVVGVQSPNLGDFMSVESGRSAVSNLEMWDASSGKPGNRFQPHGGGYYINAVACSPDGKWVVSAAGDMKKLQGEMVMLDSRSGRKRWGKSTSWRDLKTLSFSPDGRYLVSTESTVHAVVWDAFTGQLLKVLEHKTLPGCAAFSPDGDMIVTGSGTHSLILWNVATGKRDRIFDGRHADHVRSVAFSSDGRLVVSSSNDGTTRLWDVATGSELASLAVLKKEKGPLDWVVVTPDGMFDGSPGGRQQVAFRVGGGLNVVPVDRFYQDCYHPGLLAEILGGEPPMPRVEFAAKLAPQVQIVSHDSDQVVKSSQVSLRVEVTDRGGGVKGPWLLHNGAKIFSPGSPTTKGNLIERTFNVALVEGENRFEVFAASEDGSWESEPAVITLSYAQPLDESKLYLLAVGVNNYAEEAMNLRFAAPDAESIADLFIKRGEALYGKGNMSITKILDQQATSEGIQKSLSEIAKKAKPQDTLVVFLAGHGTVVGQRYYFLPHEYHTKADKVEDDIRQQGLAGDVLGDWLAAVPALKRVVIYDTCQSGGAIGIARTARNPFAFRGALERLSRAQGVFTIAATAAGDEAQEVPELGHGVLTYALLAGLGAVDVGPLKKQAIEPKEGKLVEVRDWFSFAQDKVPVLTKYHFGREQFVAFSGHGQSFPVLPLEK